MSIIVQVVHDIITDVNSGVDLGQPSFKQQSFHVFYYFLFSIILDLEVIMVIPKPLLILPWIHACLNRYNRQSTWTGVYHNDGQDYYNN